MVQIFVSHSQQDKEIVHFFLEAFAGTNVKPHLEELEKDTPSGVTSEKIKKDIAQSNAVFVLLSVNVERITHTRDWITWECGTATNKDILVFEPVETFGRVRVVVPHLKHYVLYEQTIEWRKYLRTIIESYDDSHVIPTLSFSAAGGAVINQKNPGGGALAGLALGIASLIVRDIAQPSLGIGIRCQSCSSIYKIHRYGPFRCPVCNTVYHLSGPKMTDAAR
jgi:hypothetical protein